MGGGANGNRPGVIIIQKYKVYFHDANSYFEIGTFLGFLCDDSTVLQGILLLFKLNFHHITRTFLGNSHSFFSLVANTEYRFGHHFAYPQSLIICQFYNYKRKKGISSHVTLSAIPPILFVAKI